VLVFDNSGRGNLEGDRKFINAILFAGTPAFDPIDRRRHLFGITLGSPRIDPSDQISFSAWLSALAFENLP